MSKLTFCTAAAQLVCCVRRKKGEELGGGSNIGKVSQNRTIVSEECVLVCFYRSKDKLSKKICGDV